MDFFDSLIDKTLSVIENKPQRSYGFDSNKQWQDIGYSSVILQRDTAFEISGTGFCLVTSKAADFKTVVVGEDLSEIKADRKFARVAVVEVDDCGDGQAAYDLIKKIEYVKYHFFPDGYMVRSASSSFKESARISKKALKGKITFEKLGNLMIEKFKAIPGVKGATVYFITDSGVDYSEFKAIAEKNREVTEALNQVMNNLEFDCASCNLKPICDEVEGMRELHFKNSKSGGKQRG